MAEVYNKSLSEIDGILKELGDVVYEDPQGGFVTADEYLSGDVKTKLIVAQAAAQEDTKYQRNIGALEKVIPKDKTPSEISVSIGAAFVPADVYEHYIKAHFWWRFHCHLHQVNWAMAVKLFWPC